MQVPAVFLASTNVMKLRKRKFRKFSVTLGYAMVLNFQNKIQKTLLVNNLKSELNNIQNGEPQSVSTSV